GGGGGLVFLDVDDDKPQRRPTGRLTTADVKRASKAVAGLELLEPVPAAEPPAPKRAATPAAVTPAAEPPEPVAPAVDDLVIETTAIGIDAPPPPRGSVVGLEVTNIAEAAIEEPPTVETPVDDDAPSATPVADLPLMDLDDEPAAPTAAIPMLDVEPTVAEPAIDLPLIEPEPSISLEPTSLEVSIDATPTDGLDLLDMDANDDALQIVHSGA